MATTGAIRAGGVAIRGAGLAIVALADIIGMADAGEIRDGGIRTIIRAAENTIATKTNITATTMAITMVTIKMAMTKIETMIITTIMAMATIKYLTNNGLLKGAHYFL